MGDRSWRAGPEGGGRSGPVRRGVARRVARPHRHRRQDDQGGHHVRG